MMHVSQNKTPEQMIEAIFALDLDPIKLKVMDKEDGYGWTRAEADHHELEYRRFLALTAKYPEELITLNKSVDKFWHAHILDTMKYAEDCANIFGYFLHHFPYFGMRDAEDAENLKQAGLQTRRLYEQEFGGVTESPDAQAYCMKANVSDHAKADDAYCMKAIEASAYCMKAVAPKGEASVDGAKADDAYCMRAIEASAYCMKAVAPKGEASVDGAKADDAYCMRAIEASAYCMKAVAPKGEASVDGAKADDAYCMRAIEASAYCMKAALSKGETFAYGDKTDDAYCMKAARNDSIVMGKGRPKLESAAA